MQLFFLPGLRSGLAVSQHFFLFCAGARAPNSIREVTRRRIHCHADNITTLDRLQIQGSSTLTGFRSRWRVFVSQLYLPCTGVQGIAQKALYSIENGKRKILGFKSDAGRIARSPLGRHNGNYS